MADPATLSLLQELKKHAVDAAILSSYNVSFPFYEHVVLRALQSKGCQHNVLLIDAGQAASHLGDAELGPRLAGSEYTLVPVRAPRRFHPKVGLLVGRQHSRLVLGSHNLTLAGYGGNIELTNVLTLAPGDGTRHLARRAFEFLSAWASTTHPEMVELINASMVWAPWLRERDTTEPDASLQLLVSLPVGPSLWSQLLPLVTTKVKRVTVLGPYFDNRMGLLAAVERDMGPDDLVVAVDADAHQLPSDAQHLTPAARFVDLAAWERLAEGRFAHAKLLWIELVSGESLLVTGSANPSAPAWLAGPEKRNAEAVLVQRLQPGAELPRMLGIDALGGLPKMSAAAWARVASHSRDAPVDPPASSRCWVAFATREGVEVEREFLGETEKAEIRDADGNSLLEGSFTDSPDGRSRLVLADDQMRRRCALVVVTDTTPSRQAVVHHLPELQDLATDEKRRAFRKALLDFQTSDSGFEQFLQLAEKAIFDAPSTSHLDASGRRGRERDKDSKDGGVKIGELARRGSRPSRLASGDLALILDALIHKLGAGMEPEAIESGISEEEITPTSEAARRSTALDANGGQLANLCRSKTKRLLMRLTRRLERPAMNDSPGQAVIQVAAALSVIRQVLVREPQLKWVPRGETLVEIPQMWEFFKRGAMLMYRADAGIAFAAEAEAGAPFAELQTACALLLWTAHRCGLDVSTALSPTLDYGFDEPDEDEILENLMGLPLLLTCLVQSLPEAAERRLLFDEQGLDWLERHVTWAEDVSTAPAKPGNAGRGAVVRCRTRGGSFISIVAEDLGDNVRLLDPNSGEIKEYRKSAVVGAASAGASGGGVSGAPRLLQSPIPTSRRS
jgi:hypothetical protein